MAAEADFDITVSSDGDVSPRDIERARENLLRVAEVVPNQVLRGELRLVMEPAPHRPRPAKVEGALDVDGRLVRAHVAAPTMQEAVDRFADRLRSRVTDFVGRLQDRRNAGQEAERGEWRRDDIPTDRPDYFDRSPEEREVVRRKTFATPSSTPEEAVFDMETLDHDFFLFRNSQTGDANVVRRMPDGYELIQPTAQNNATDVGNAPIRLSEEVPPNIALRDAITALNIGSQPFLFFIDADEDEGAVVYRRYDGHYGLITLTSE